MIPIPTILLGEFRLKCTDCGKRMIHVTGGNLLQLGDRPDGVSCPLCKSSNVITIEVPSRFEGDSFIQFV